MRIYNERTCLLFAIPRRTLQSGLTFFMKMRFSDAVIRNLTFNKIRLSVVDLTTLFQTPCKKIFNSPIIGRVTTRKSLQKIICLYDVRYLPSKTWT